MSHSPHSQRWELLLYLQQDNLKHASRNRKDLRVVQPWLPWSPGAAELIKVVAWVEQVCRLPPGWNKDGGGDRVEPQWKGHCGWLLAPLQNQTWANQIP